MNNIPQLGQFGQQVPNLGQPQPQPNQEQAARMALAAELGTMSRQIYVQAASDFVFIGKSDDRKGELTRIAKESHAAAMEYYIALGVLRPEVASDE